MENLDLSPYVKGYNKETYKYDLYGVANHIGNVMGGHYFSYVKTKEGNWYEFVIRVKPIKAENVISQELCFLKKRIIL